MSVSFVSVSDTFMDTTKWDNCGGRSGPALSTDRFTPPLVSFRERELSVQRMWVCVHCEHKHTFNYLTHIQEPVWGARIVHTAWKTKGERGLAMRLAGLAQWELAPGFKRNTFRVPAGMCSTAPLAAITLGFSTKTKVLTQFSFCSAAFGSQMGERHRF